MPPKSKSAPKTAAVGSLVAVIGDEDTVTGMLLAGVGEVDARRKREIELDTLKALKL